MEPARFDEMRPGLLRHRGPHRRHGPGRHLGLAVLPVARVGILRRRLLAGAGPATSGLACLRAFNDWHLRGVGRARHPERIIPLQLPWLADVAVAAAEVRANAARGFKAVSFPEFPAQLGLPSIFSGAVGPLLRRLRGDRHGRVPAHRRLVLGPAPLARPALRAPAHLSSRSTRSWRPASGCGRASPLRFPGLKVAMSEGGIGWVPDADGPGRLRAAALGVGHREHAPGRRTCCPSEVLRRNFWFCSIDDPSAVPQRHVIGVDHIMVESDYPHADSSWPDTQRVLADDLGRAPRRRAAGRGRRATPPRCSATRCPPVDDWRDPDRVSGPRATLRSRRAPARSSTPTVTWSSPSRPGPACPTRTGPASAPTATATSTSSWAAPRSWPCRSAPWPARAPPSTTRPRFRPLAEAQPGGSDPRRPPADMDAEGIDQAVLYPTIGLYFSVVDDPAAAVALARGLQRLAGRLLRRRPAPALRGRHAPAAGPGGGGPRAPPRRRPSSASSPASSGPTPASGRSLSDRAYDAGVGGGRGARRAHRDPRGQLGDRADARVGPPLQPARPPRRVALVRGRCSPAPSSSPSGRSSGTRACACVFLESSGGWAPFWLERLDEQAESFGGFCPDMALRPSEYFARQCAISFEVDERTLPALVPFVGAERIVWGSDYPHHDATFPGAVDAIRATVAPCPTATQATVLGLNARGIYRLPARHAGPAGLVDDYFTAVTAQDTGLVRALFAPGRRLRRRRRRAAQGRDAICGYYTEHTFTFDGLPARSRAAAGRGHTGRRSTSTSTSAAPTGRCTTCSRPTGRTSPSLQRQRLRGGAARRTRADGPTAAGGLRPAGAAGRAAGGRAAPPSPRRARARPTPDLTVAT